MIKIFNRDDEVIFDIEGKEYTFTDAEMEYEKSTNFKYLKLTLLDEDDNIHYLQHRYKIL